MTSTEAENHFGSFIDAGMTGGVRLVRNNRVIGYLLPAAEYQLLSHTARAHHQRRLGDVERELTPSQFEALRLYSERQITSTEAKASLKVDRWGLLDLLGKHGLRLPRLPRERVSADVEAAFPMTGALPPEA